MKIGLIQQHNTGNMADNRQRLGEKIKKLAHEGAELIVLQELHNGLYFCQTEDVSIFDQAYLYLPGHENIMSHSYLSEQIRGDIFNPTYYFDETNADRLYALDLLLMTQGWRRYVWDE